MLKRIISLLLCVVMVVTMLPIQSAATEAETYINLLEVTETTEEDTVPAETTEPEETSGPTENPEPEGTIEPEAEEQNCTGLLDCPAENHNDSCEKKLADEKNTADKAAADAVLAQIAELPTLEEIQEKPMAEQIADYGQVQEVYSQYGMLSAEQQSLLPPAEELFKHYFDYFNSLVSLVWSGSGTSSSPFLISNEQELRSLAQQVAAGNTYSGKYFRLSQSVALTSAWTPIGTESYPFRGTFDGNGNTVSGMTASGDYIGLFGYVGSGAVLKNLTLTCLRTDA